MQAYTHHRIGTAIIAVITLIITNLFSTGTTLAEDTNKDTSKMYCLPAVLEATDQAFPGFTTSSSVRKQIKMDAIQEKYFDSVIIDATPTWLNTMRTTKVLDGKAGSCDQVSDWLATKGFPMKLNGSKAAAGVFDLKLQWQTHGVAGDIRIDNQSFATAKMGISSLEGVFTSPKHDKPIFQMKPTDSTWEVFVTEFDGNIGKDEELLLSSMEVLTDLKVDTELGNKFRAVSIPKVDTEKTVDISFLAGMSSKEFSVDQALKIVRLKFSEKGMEASSAVVFHTRGMSPASYEIRSKFLVVARLKGYKLPAFVALCDKDSWMKGK